jgi:RNA polymerase sigma factor (sigma-70 family)
MVLGVCRRALKNPHDAEDAFQAVFLVLARRAGSVRVDDSLGRWLYGVSRKVASRARKRSERLRSREVSATSIDAPEPAHRGSAEALAERSDLRAVILDELSCLPGRYREAIEACDLDGCTHEEAARRLGWPVGTVRSRLSRGRDQLRGRLERRGLGLPAIASPVAGRLANPVSPALATATAQAAVRFAMRRAFDGSFPVAVAALTEEALRTMTLAKLTVAMPAALLIAGVATATTQFGAAGGGAVPPEVPKAVHSSADSGGGTGQAQGAPAGIPPKAQGGVARIPPAAENAIGSVSGSSVTLNPDLDVPFTLDLSVGEIEFEGAAKQIEIQMGSTIVLRSIDREDRVRFTAHNAASGESSTYRVPEGIIAVPIASESAVVLDLKGEGISVVAAYSPQANTWVVHPLAAQVDGHLVPIVSKGLAAIQDGHRVYAFSASAQKWDVIERAEGADGPPWMNNDYVLCEDEERVYVFGAQTGEWAAIEIE